MARPRPCVARRARSSISPRRRRRSNVEIFGSICRDARSPLAPTRPSIAEQPLASLVWFHGGGLVSGGLDTHDSLMAELAAAARCRVVAVDYRLAPEHRFPAAHDDALDALNAIHARCEEMAIDPARLGVGGDSAGGGLAAYAAVRTRASLKLLFLLCPVLDPLARERSRFELGTGHLIEESTMERYWALYRDGEIESEDARVAPLRAENFVDYPPTRIHTAEYDPLKDEGAALAREIAAAGKPARLEEHAGLIHHFYGLTGVIPSARAALAKIGADLAEGLVA